MHPEREFTTSNPPASIPIGGADGAAPVRHRSPRNRTLVLFALALLILPTWFGAVPSRKLAHERGAVEPLRIDVRTAPWYEFMLLPGVGEARARAIVESRRLRGGFSSVDDLRDVPGLPRDWLEQVRAHLRCGG